ncbi:Acyl-CoA:lysophosphatidylglycerol acyltransferase 1, partial [Araneus ventricosus]
GKHVRDYQMKRLRDHLLKAYLGRNRKWIVLFPEGGFLSKRLETSIKYATKNNFPILEHVTLPRIGAMELILNTLGPHANLKDTIDEDVSLLREVIENISDLLEFISKYHSETDEEINEKKPQGTEKTTLD